MTSLSDLEILVIERACEKLIYEFFEAIDLRHERQLENLFTEDARYARPIEPNTVLSGRETIVKMFEARPAGRVSRHLCSNVRITVDSATRAHGVSRVVLTAGSPQPPGGSSDASLSRPAIEGLPAPSEPPAPPQFGLKADARQLVGEFDDEFVKTPQGWRFSSRRGRVILHT